MKVAFNYLGDAIVKKIDGSREIFRAEEMQIIGRAYYRWVQKKQPMIHEECTSIEVTP